jgi:hypothetical protein
VGAMDRQRVRQGMMARGGRRRPAKSGPSARRRPVALGLGGDQGRGQAWAVASAGGNAWQRQRARAWV